MSEDINHESLKKSVEQVGRLYPRLVNQNGKILDGNHRTDTDKDWETKIVQTENRFKELLVRAHAHHRRRVPQEETRALIEEMAEALEKDGIARTEVAVKLVESLPYSESYTRSLIPDIYKNPLKAQVGQKGGEKTATISEQKLQDVALEEASLHKVVPKAFDAAAVKTCERCGVQTAEPKTWHGHTLCSQCETRANFNPAAYDGYFRYLERGKAGLVQKAKPVAHIAELGEYRRAVMSSQHSKMEDKIVNKLRAKGYTVETDIPMVVREVTTTPDFNIILIQKTVHGYIDGTVHNGKRRDKDDDLRLLLKKRFPTDMIVAVDVKGDSDKEADDKIKEIEEAMKW